MPPAREQKSNGLGGPGAKGVWGAPLGGKSPVPKGTGIQALPPSGGEPQIFVWAFGEPGAEDPKKRGGEAKGGQKEKTGGGGPSEARASDPQSRMCPRRGPDRPGPPEARRRRDFGTQRGGLGGDFCHASHNSLSPKKRARATRGRGKGFSPSGPPACFGGPAKQKCRGPRGGLKKPANREAFPPGRWGAPPPGARGKPRHPQGPAGRGAPPGAPPGD